MPESRWRRSIEAFLQVLFLVAVGCTGREVMAPPPATHFDLDSERPPRLPPTSVEVPVTFDVSSALELLEQALPRHFGDIDKRTSVPGKKRMSFAYEVNREPFAADFRNDTIYLSSTIRYQGKGWYDPPIGPDISGSCGINGPKPRARVVVAVHARIDHDWRLKTRTRVARLDPLTQSERDQCEVSFLNLDVTGKVLSAAKSALQSKLPRVDALLARQDIRTSFEKLWTEIQKPIRLTDSVYLLLQPTRVRLGAIQGDRITAGATVGITADPKIETGPRPEVAMTPLPPLTTTGEATGLNLMVEGRFEYSVISDLFTKALKGKRVEKAGGTVVIREVRAFGVGGGKLALGVRFAGTVSGLIYFVGTPKYDPSSGRIFIPDLDYDTSSAGLLVQGLAWLQGDDLRDFLRAHASFPSGETLNKLTTLAMNGMNRDLAPGVHLGATLGGTQVLAIQPRAQALVLQAQATGIASLTLDRNFFGRWLKPADSTETATKQPASTDTTP